MMKRHLLFYILVLSLFSCARKESTDVQRGRDRNIPDQEMWNFRVKATNQGQLNAVIRAGYMRRFENQSLAEFKDGVEIDFYDKNGEHTSRLTSDSGRFRESNMNVKAIGNVEVHSDSGISLYTEELTFDQEKDLIYSTVDVKVTTLDGDTLSGKGFESNSQLTNWQIINPHDGVYHKSVDLDFKQEQDSLSDNSVSHKDSLDTRQ